MSDPVTAPQPFVFSIRPKYVTRILEGVKVWEFRTRRPTLKLEDVILIYETAPRSMIVATAQVSTFIVGTPAHVWLATKDRADSLAGGRGVTAAEFNTYYNGREMAVALHLLNVVKLPVPQPLPEGMAPPQPWSRYKGVWS